MAKQRKHIKVTYSTLGSPDPLLHEYFEEDVADLKNNLGQRYQMLINGEWVEASGLIRESLAHQYRLAAGRLRARLRRPGRSSSRRRQSGLPRLARYALERTLRPAQSKSPT